MAGLYRGKNNYHVVFEQVADFSVMGVGRRDLAVRAAIERYAAVLEQPLPQRSLQLVQFF